MPTRRPLPILLALLLLALCSLGLALAVGSLPLPLSEVAAALFGRPVASADIVLTLRLPRALAGFACGGLLALAGALMQVLLRNPLADPYVLGVSGGASVGAMLVILFGFAGVAGVGIEAGAFIGALAALLLVFGLARGDGSWTQTRLLLTGVIVASGCGAVVGLLLSIAPETQLRGMLFWLMGDLGQPGRGWPPLLVLGVALLLALPLARDLNLLARGEGNAQALGVNVGRLRLGVY
ncbi:MAG TPA: iron chelate uptake ABC transporter family permease subunit, partial [Rhodocyclaceae bacterium]|nr:iron chelate uptake ABC transporter family permease subunit [Rhodocyclaceae bacterium]